MKTLLSKAIGETARHSHTRLFHGIILIVVVGALTTSLPAQTATTQPASNANAAADNTNTDNRVRRANFSPADIQARILANLREQLAVKDDAEWSLIAERITAVINLRRNLAVGGFGGFGNRAGGGNRPGAVANPELDALRAAVADNLPDDEIKARLERVREVRKQNETKLAKAQDDLRAVLTIRQEAAAVAAGLLP